MTIISLALLIVDDKILLFRREQSPNDKFSGKFGLPGGHVKENENTLDGAKRETMEETGLRLINPIYVNSYKFDDNKIYLYAEELKDANGIRLNHEHTEYKLFNPEELETDGSVIPTTKFMYNDYLNKRGVKPSQQQKQTNEDLEYEHVDNAEPSKDKFKIGQKLSLLNIALDEGTITSDVESKLRTKYPNLTIDIYQNDKHKIITLSRVIVPKELREQGIGTSFMNDLVLIANKLGYKIVLTPDSTFGGNKSRLLNFYKRFGFIPNKNKNRDFSHKEDMYKNPQGLDEGKIIRHKWNKIHDNKLKHAKCERCNCVKYYDDRWGKVIFIDRFGNTHPHNTPSCEIPNTKLNEQTQRIKSLIKEIENNEFFSIGDGEDDWMDASSEERAERLFGASFLGEKQTPLQKRFSEIMVNKLGSDDEIESYKWSVYNAILIELKKLGEHKLMEEVYYWITDKQAPYNVFDNAAQKSRQSPEIIRLRQVMQGFKHVESGHEPTIDDFLNPTDER